MVLETSGGYIILRREINSKSIKHNSTFSTKASCKEEISLFTVSLHTKANNLPQEVALLMTPLLTLEEKKKKIFQDKLMYVSFNSI